MRTIWFAILCGVAADAGVIGSGTLTSPAQAVLWSGSVGPEDAGLNEVPECASTRCERFDLTLSLPPGVWLNKPGGVQIAIRWAGLPLFNNLRLYVYRGGSLIARSDGIISTAQSVFIPEPANDSLQVYVAYDPDSPSPAIAYEGLAEVEYRPNPAPLRRLLPDLRPKPQRNASFDPGGIFFDEISSAYPSCYVSEVREEGARTCLRFDQIMANAGEGPIDLRFTVPSGTTPPSVSVSQHIFRSDGTVEDRPAGQVEFHPFHGHYHFTSFGLSRLWATDAAGSRSGSVPLKQNHGRRPVGAQLTRTGRKVSFCLADIEMEFWGQKGDGPRTYNAPDCLLPAFSDATGDHFFQGISNGWADVYDWYLPDQYIEVSGVPDGLYILETIADPDARLVESDRSNNCTSVYVRLSNMGSSSPTAVILGLGPNCSVLP